jgi:hypothetical protein
MSDIIARAQAALEGVTEGPWEWNRSTLVGGRNFWDDVLSPGQVECMSYCYGGTSTIDGYKLDADKGFIASARTLVPELVTELKAARAQHKPTEHDEYISGLVETLSGLAIDLSTIAIKVNKATLDLAAEFPPIPGE